MSDESKLEFAEKWIDWAKKNTMLVSILTVAIPAVGGAFYTGITELNKAKDDLAAFHQIVEEFPAVQRKAEALTEKTQAQQETIMKMQEKLADALINSREAKIVAESTQKEARAAANASKVEIEATAHSLRTELNTLKRATTNPLGK